MHLNLAQVWMHRDWLRTIMYEAVKPPNDPFILKFDANKINFISTKN